MNIAQYNFIATIAPIYYKVPFSVTTDLIMNIEGMNIKGNYKGEFSNKEVL